MKHEKDLGTVTVSQKAAMQTVEYITKNTDGIVRMAEKSRRLSKRNTVRSITPKASFGIFTSVWGMRHSSFVLLHT